MTAVARPGSMFTVLSAMTVPDLTDWIVPVSWIRVAGAFVGGWLLSGDLAPGRRAQVGSHSVAACADLHQLLGPPREWDERPGQRDH